MLGQGASLSSPVTHTVIGGYRAINRSTVRAGGVSLGGGYYDLPTGVIVRGLEQMFWLRDNHPPLLLSFSTCRASSATLFPLVSLFLLLPFFSTCPLLFLKIFLFFRLCDKFCSYLHFPPSSILCFPFPCFSDSSSQVFAVSSPWLPVSSSTLLLLFSFPLLLIRPAYSTSPHTLSSSPSFSPFLLLLLPLIVITLCWYRVRAV